MTISATYEEPIRVDKHRLNFTLDCDLGAFPLSAHKIELIDESLSRDGGIQARRVITDPTSELHLTDIRDSKISDCRRHNQMWLSNVDSIER